MDHKKPDETNETFTVSEVQKMYDDEVANVTRAAQMRIQQFKELAEGYAAGAFTPQQAAEKILDHDERWGDIFPGVSRDASNMSDAEIAADMGAATSSFAAKEESNRRNIQPPGARDWKKG